MFLKGPGADRGSPCLLLRPLPVILLQKVMVSPGTHLVKNHESQLEKQQVQNYKCLSLYVTRQLT